MIDAGLPNQSMLNEAFTAYKALEASLAEQPAQQEPVAWLVYAKGSRRYFTLTFDVEKVPEIYKGGEAVPLYTSPPAQRKPLPQTPPAYANINQRIAYKAGWRDAETAHGIKGDA